MLLILTVWSFLILLILSPDSPLFGLARRVDSAWFFVGGKALMNNMTPYVDFADSKGIMLWLIYGIGYLLSPTTYVGVYVMASLFYAGTLFYNYKTARLFLQDQGKALLAALTMMFVYFFPWFHFEVRCEDFAILFISISINILFKRLYGQRNMRKNWGDFFLLGVCFMCLTLIKYSAAVMQGIIILTALYDLLRTKESLVKGFLHGIAGALLIALPFVIYLTLTGALSAFVNEYFINTFKTVSESSQVTYLDDVNRLISDPHKILFFVVIGISSILLGIKQKNYKLVPLIVSLFFMIITIRHSFWNYYFTICNVFILWLFIDLLSIHKATVRNIAYGLVGIYLAAVCLYGNLINGELRLITIFTHHPDTEAYHEISDVMAGTEKPRILNYECNEFGFGMKYQALPAGKQWSYQTDSTPEMISNHREILTSRKADFVITYCREDQYDKKPTLKFIEDNGYELKLKKMYMGMPFYIYKRK